MIVVGPEPEAAYRHQALALGAGGWVCRDHVGEEVSAAMRAALGCRHGPCPPGSPGELLERRVAQAPEVLVHDGP